MKMSPSIQSYKFGFDSHWNENGRKNISRDILVLIANLMKSQTKIECLTYKLS